MKEHTKLGQRSKVNGRAFPMLLFIAVTLSIPLAFAYFRCSRGNSNAIGAYFLYPGLGYALGAAEDLYQVRGGVAPILRERCDKVTLRNWLSWRGERLAGAEGKLSLGETASPFLTLRLILPSFLPSTKSNSIVLRSGTTT